MPQVDVDKRVLLSSIKSLTFFSDAYTQGRRTSPIPQLTCNGKLCNLFQPHSVACTNIGGYGINVQWKCEADLPNTLRFGKLDINCEGWQRPGDPFVLEGSCALSYELLKLPSAIRDGTGTSRFSFMSILMIVASVLIILYLIARFLSGRDNSSFSSRSFFSGRGSGGNFRSPPPPPYSRSPPPPPKTHPSDDSNWRPGFWTGLGLGSTGAYLWANRNAGSRYENRRNGAYDWERPYGAGWRSGFDQGSSSSFMMGSPPSSEGFWSGSRARNTDRGEGSSNLGSIRTAYGLARSSTR